MATQKKDNDTVNPVPLRRAKAWYEISKDNGNAPVKQAIFQHSVLCQTFFPYRNPGETDYWKRQQGRATLSVQALKQENPITGETVTLGIPYGAKVRLMMAFINTEIVRKQSPVIEVADSMTAFIKNDLNLDTNGRTIRQVKEQLSRLAASIVSISFADAETGRVQRVDNKIVKGYDLWFPKSPDQKTFWSSEIHVTDDYAKSLLEHAVPLDMRAVAALSNNPMALDIYTWLAYRLHRVPRNKPVFIPWAAAYEQFGFGYSKIRQFRTAFLKNLQQVKLVYPDAKLEVADHKDSKMPAGLVLHSSPSAIGKKLYLPPNLKRWKEAIRAKERGKS